MIILYDVTDDCQGQRPATNTTVAGNGSAVNGSAVNGILLNDRLIGTIRNSELTEFKLKFKFWIQIEIQIQFEMTL